MAGKLVIRLDDALDTQYTKWYPFLESKGVKAVVAVLTAEVGGEGYMTWAQVLEMHNNGYEIIDHGMYAAYGLDEVPENQAESEIIQSKADLNAQNLYPQHFCPHKFGQNSEFVRQTALKYFKTCHAGYSTGGDEAMNKRMISIQDIYAMRGDIAGNYNWDDTDGVALTKTEIYKASEANRLCITFGHVWTQDKEDGLSEIIDCAKSLNVEITTLSNAYNNGTVY